VRESVFTVHVCLQRFGEFRVTVQQYVVEWVQSLTGELTAVLHEREHVQRRLQGHSNSP